MALTAHDAITVPADESPRVSIVVPTARRPQRLAACLRSLAAATRGAPACETVIVLNAADDETTELARSRVRGARIVASEVNLGVAGAGNLGREAARGELLVLVHDDVVCEPGWLAAMMAVAAERPEAGAVGSRLLHPDGGPQSAGAVVFNDGSSWPLPAPTEPGPDATAADYVMSASLLVRTEIWDAVGGMDERFFPAYHVDADLGLATWSLGRSVLCARDSRVRHRQGSSSSARFRDFLIERNRGQLLDKWGAVLAEHDPRPRAPEEAVAPARRRLEPAAERVRLQFRPGAPAAAAPSRASAPDRAARERDALQRASAVQSAYSAALEARVADVEAAEERERHAHRAAAEAHRRLEEAERTLQAIYAGGWWRLRGRLASVRRLGRRLRRRR